MFFLRWINALAPGLYEFLKSMNKLNLFHGVILYFADSIRYTKVNKDLSFKISIAESYPNFTDRFENAGVFPKHYFIQDIWAAKKIHASGVSVHTDIGSRIDGFVAHVATFCKIKVIDVRTLKSPIEDIEFHQSSLPELSGVASGSVSSLSSLHVFEHLGLGRYGDPILPNILEDSAEGICRILAPKSNFYFSVPVGKERLQFNSHRIFDPATICHLFKKLELVEFSLIDDNENLLKDFPISEVKTKNYACGLFHFRKV